MSFQIPKQHNQKPPDSFQKYFVNFRLEWERWFLRASEILKTIFPASSDMILSNKVFGRHPERDDEVKAGTAVSVTNKAGQKIVNVIANDSQIQLATATIRGHRERVDELKAGTNITLTRKAGQVTINTTAVDDAQDILANRVFGA